MDEPQSVNARFSSTRGIDADLAVTPGLADLLSPTGLRVAGGVGVVGAAERHEMETKMRGGGDGAANILGGEGLAGVKRPALLRVKGEEGDAPTPTNAGRGVAGAGGGGGLWGCGERGEGPTPMAGS